MAHSTITLSSLYSSGQCLLSVLGSIGVILLFAGIPQLIYAPQVNLGNLMTFLLGALLISLMVAGNAFIGYKYRQLIRERRQEQRENITIDDKPPSYDDVFKEDGLPPAYISVAVEKPPKYEDVSQGAFNWSTIARASTSSWCLPSNSSGHRVINSSNRVTPIVPLHRSITLDEDQFSGSLTSEICDKSTLQKTRSVSVPHENR